MNQNPVEEGQKFPLTIRRMGINGEGIGYFKKAVVFVPGAITGEEVVVEAVKVRDRFTEAKLNKIRKNLQTELPHLAQFTRRVVVASCNMWPIAPNLN